MKFEESYDQEVEHEISGSFTIYFQDNQDGQIEGETVITQQEVSRITQKHTIENEESLEPAPDIEIPPPMPVQDHTIALGTTEISEKFVSILRASPFYVGQRRNFMKPWIKKFKLHERL